MGTDVVVIPLALMGFWDFGRIAALEICIAVWAAALDLCSLIFLDGSIFGQRRRLDLGTNLTPHPQPRIMG